MNEEIKNTEPKSPSYYIRKRLFKNIPAVIGMVFITLAFIIAILGYHIMPDDTRKANDGAVQIQKLGAGSEVKMLKIKRNLFIPDQNVFQKMFSGRENEFTIIPITDYRFVDDKIEVKEYHRSNVLTRGISKDWKSLSLLNVAKALSPGENHGTYSDGKKLDESTMLPYTEINGERKEISIGELRKEVEQNNIEVRMYFLGTDKSGRDILSQLILGTRVSLSIGFIAVLISIVVGVLLGAVAGFFGGKVDDIILWLMTVVWSIPGIMLVIAISLALSSKGIWVAFVAVGLTMWVEVARVVRGQIMSVKQKNYIESARALGFRNGRIILYHILPNILGSMIVIGSANFASAILLEAGLSFLGLGVQPPTPSWGMMVHEGYSIIGSNSSWGLVIFPGLCIMIMVLSFNLFGNGLRDAYDPKNQV